MPRVSAAAFGVVPVTELPFPPPPHLSEAEKIVFRDVAGTADHGHFRAEDRELLALYACHTISARKLMKKRRRQPEEERELRALTALIITLSTKLRLGPKSRSPDNRRAATAGMLRPGPRPWDRQPEDDEPEEKPEKPAAPDAPRWT